MSLTVAVGVQHDLGEASKREKKLACEGTVPIPPLVVAVWMEQKLWGTCQEGRNWHVEEKL